MTSDQRLILIWALMLMVAGVNHASGAECERLVRLTSDGLFKQRPAWSPDGMQLSFARHEGDAIRLYVVAADGAGERRLTEYKHPEYDAVWSPDGKRLALARVTVSGTQGDVDVYAIAADGTDPQQLAGSQGKLSHEESPAWKPDGKEIAFTSTRDGNQELYVAAADGSNVRRLTNDNGLDAHPAWSPDGLRLAFATDRWGDLELALIDADGTNLTRLTTSRGLDDYPAWSPDGTHLAFTSNRDSNYEIYRIDASGGEPTNLTQDEELDHFAAWSPGGNLAFVSNRDGGFEIYLLPPAP
jgi:TolB protein